MKLRSAIRRPFGFAFSRLTGNVYLRCQDVFEYEEDVECNDRGGGSDAGPGSSGWRPWMRRGVWRVVWRGVVWWRRWHWLRLFRLWMGSFARVRLAGRIWVLWLCSGVREAHVRPSCLRGARVCRARVRHTWLQHAGLCHTGLRHAGLQDSSGSSDCGARKHSASNAGSDSSGCGRGQRGELHFPSQCAESKRLAGDGFSHQLQYDPSHWHLDPATRPNGGTDLLLDDSAAGDLLFCRQPIDVEVAARRCPGG
jgi:hypothetical protein